MLQHGQGILPEFDERREIGRLLKHLSPARRIDWLKWCCRQVSKPAAETTVIQNDGTVSAVFWDAMSLFWGSGLTMQRAGEQLVKMVRGRA